MRHLTRLCLLAACCLLLATPTYAQSPWRWTDISEKIGNRRNRPIWALAQARGFWYFTDGLELSQGGQVRRMNLNGTQIHDLKRDLLAAGLTRVDDIVSDGKTILFLKNLTTRNSNFEVVSFDGVNFVNRTERLRAWFDPDEGIASVNGKDGAWAFVTTKGKVRIFPHFENLRSRPTASSGVEPAVPVGDLPEFAQEISYCFRRASCSEGRGYLPVAVVPFDRGWFLAQRRSIGDTTFLSYNPLTGTEDLTARIGRIARLQAIASNGSSVLLAGASREEGATDRVVLVDPNGVKDLSEVVQFIPSGATPRLSAAWNGRSWMLINGKDLLRFNGERFESFGKTRDYFLNIAGSSDGTFLLGGIVSDLSREEVPARLTAKLVKVVEAL